MYRETFFTLTELLTVIAACLILAAMLLPAVANAQRKAHKISCNSNLHQLHFAFMLYAADNENLMPPYIRNSTYGHAGTNWARYTSEYYPDIRILKCPASPKPGPKDKSIEELHLYDGNYGWNFDGTQANRGPISSAIKEPSSAYIVFDSGDQCIIYGANNWNNLMEELDLDWDSGAEGANRHDNAANAAFLDGHVENRILDDFIAAPCKSSTPPWYIQWEGGKLEKAQIPYPER